MNLRERQIGAREAGWTMNSVRRSCLFRPLAVLMAILMLPAVSWMDSGSRGGDDRIKPLQASAQINLGGCASTTNTILQSYCLPDGSIEFANDLIHFESEAVSTYLGLHKLPSTEAQLIYSTGRDDLRNQIRGVMVDLLRGIIYKDASLRTPHEQKLYNWMQKMIQQNEILLYTEALSEINRFRVDPCRFRLDPDVAAAYKLSFSGTNWCFPLQSSLFPPTMPDINYFLAYGIKKSYHTPAVQHYYFGGLVAGTSVFETEAARIVQGTIGILAAEVASIAVFAGFLQQATLIVSEVLVGINASIQAAQSFASAVSSVIAPILNFAIFAGPVGIFIASVVAIFQSAISLYTDSQANANVNDIRTRLTQAQIAAPDLSNFLRDGLGSQKLRMALVGQTVPNRPSTSPLPVHGANDPNFSITPSAGGSASIGATLTYRDWSNNIWTVQTYGGWFVQTCQAGVNSTGPCPVTINNTPPGSTTPSTISDSLTTSLQFVDWSGRKLIASRTGSAFSIIKSDPAATDVPCPAERTTGVSPGTDFSNCSVYVSNTIPLTDGSGNRVSVSLSTFSAPAFTGAASFAFAPGVASTQTITATGNPNPTICLTSSGLPPQFTVPSCSPSPLTITFNGNSNTPVGNYNLTFNASNAAGSTSGNFVARVGTDVKIISPAILNTSYNQPVNFTVVATGQPRPTFTIDSGVDLAGLTFRDNLNGTATISGTAGGATFFSPCVDIAGETCPRIRASNGITSDRQIFTVQVASPPVATAAGPFSTTFTAGASNEFTLLANQTTTPVSWSKGTRFPSWLQLRSNRDGTGTFTGTPPAGTLGLFNADVVVTAEGTNLSTGATYSINVTNQPVFTSSNIFNFTVGTFSLLTGPPNVRATTGVLSIDGSLPRGLSSFFYSNEMLIYPTLYNPPPVGSGGSYPIRFLATAPSGTATQDATINIFEAPTFSGAPLAVMFAGRPGSVSIETRGYPSTGTVPGLGTTAPTSPTQGRGMFFTTQGLPPGLQASNLSLGGFPSGTLNIQGTPLSTQVGTYRAQITAANGVGSPAQSNLTLLVYPYAPTTPVNLLTSYVFNRDANNNYVATVVVANSGSSTAQNVTIGSARLGGVSGTVAPASVASIGPASTATFTILYPAGSIPNTPVQVLTISGTYTGGSFSSGGRVTLP
jgi:hypothetical protein